MQGLCLNPCNTECSLNLNTQLVLLTTLVRRGGDVSVHDDDNDDDAGGDVAVHDDAEQPHRAP